MASVTEQAGKLLGKQVDYQNLGDGKDILVPFKRSDALNECGVKIRSKHGFDRWHLYEGCFLLKNGLPVHFGLKIIIPHDSEYIIESKSMKLYFFSFNNKRFDTTNADEAKKLFKEQVKKDLSEATNSDVEVLFEEFRLSYPLKDVKWVLCDPVTPVEEYTGEDPSFLENHKVDYISYNNFIVFKFQNGRSNCRVTKQPDWFQSLVLINPMKNLGDAGRALGDYINSFRNEFHFHEECTDMMFDRIMRYWKPKKLAVFNLYTRRGGIDISCFRWTGFNENIIDDFHLYFLRTPYQ